MRSDDDMLDHEKWRRAIRKGGDGVLTTWFRLTSWCSRRLTDGVVPSDMVNEVAELVGSKARAKTLLALVEARLVAWADPDEDTLDIRLGVAEPTPGPRRDLAGLVVVGYLQRNPSRAEVTAERGRLAQVKRNQRHGKDVPASRPVPSRPVPSPHSGKSESDRAHATPLQARTYTMPSAEPPQVYLDEAVMRGVGSDQARSTWEHYFGAGLPERGVERLHDWVLLRAKERANATARVGSRNGHHDPDERLQRQADRVAMLRRQEAADEASQEGVPS